MLHQKLECLIEFIHYGFYPKDLFKFSPKVPYESPRELHRGISIIFFTSRNSFWDFSSSSSGDAPRNISGIFYQLLLDFYKELLLEFRDSSRNFYRSSIRDYCKSFFQFMTQSMTSFLNSYARLSPFRNFSRIFYCVSSKSSFCNSSVARSRNSRRVLSRNVLNFDYRVHYFFLTRLELMNIELSAFSTVVLLNLSKMDY